MELAGAQVQKATVDEGLEIGEDRGEFRGIIEPQEVAQFVLNGPQACVNTRTGWLNVCGIAASDRGPNELGASDLPFASDVRR